MSGTKQRGVIGEECKEQEGKKTINVKAGGATDSGTVTCKRAVDVTTAREEKKRKRSSKYGRDWKLKVDTPMWEPGHSDVVVQIKEKGDPRGLTFRCGKLGLLGDTTKPLSQLRVTEGFKLTHVDNKPIAKVVDSNDELITMIREGLVKTMKFKPPSRMSEIMPFGPGQEFFRLFTDGGRKSPHYSHGEAGCGYVIVKGPFVNYKEGMISDKDGEVIAEGCAYLGKGATVNMAEYVGLMIGLRRCLELGLTRIQHMCDSKLVVGYETKNAPYAYNLHGVHMICKRFRAVFEQMGGGIVTLHTLREGNGLADEQANKSISFQGPRLTGVMAVIDPDLFPDRTEIRSWYNQPQDPPVVWDVPIPTSESEPSGQSDGFGFDTDAEVCEKTFVERLRPELRNKRMRTDIKRAMKWFEESISDEQVAHWDGWVLPFVPRNARAAVIRVFDAILSRMPSREEDSETDSFSSENWKYAYRNAPHGSGAGPDGLLPDVLHQLIAFDESFAGRLFQYHSYVAHGSVGLCLEKFLSANDHDEWARLLYVIPRWLLHAVPSKVKEDKLNARGIRDRVEQFFSGEWEKLERSAARSQSVPPIMNSSRSATSTASMRAIRLVKSHGEISAAARCVKEPCWSLTKQGCDQADDTGSLWDAVQEKVESLHPPSRKADVLSEKSLQKYNDGKPWGNGGLSQRLAEIHFSATMTILLKPRGDHPNTVFERLMNDWRLVDTEEWTVRPIAAGNAHDRLINRARLAAITEDLADEFVSEGLVQLAFGTKRGTAVAFLFQIIHQECFPEHDTELCDGKNAYNTSSRKQMAVAILTAKSRKVRRQYGYFLMGHRLQSRVYARGLCSKLVAGEAGLHITEEAKVRIYEGWLVLSQAGVRQGDPWAGFAFSLSLARMLETMRSELPGKINDTVITCIVDDVKVQGPVHQRELIHKWLETRGKQWGYMLNTQPGKTIIIEGRRSDIVKGLNGRAALPHQQESVKEQQISEYERANMEQRQKNKAIWEALKKGSEDQSAVLAAVAAKALAKEHSILKQTTTDQQLNIQGETPGTAVRVKNQPAPHTKICGATATACSAVKGRVRAKPRRYIARSATLDNKEIKEMKEKATATKIQRSVSLTSKAAKATTSTAGHGPADGDWEGWVYYGSEDEKHGVPAGLYRVGTAINHTDDNRSEDKRICAFEEYDMDDNKMNHPVTATYLNTKRSDARTEPRFVSQTGLKQTAGKYVGLPVGDDTGRRIYLKEKSDAVVKRIQSAGAVGDWEVAYRLVRYCAVAWARYPTMAIPMRGDTDEAMLSYIRNVDDTIDDAVTKLMGHKMTDLKRREIGLPGKFGGSGLADLRSAVPASYVSTVIAMVPTLRIVSPSLYQFFIDQLNGDDRFYVKYAYEKVLSDFYWHDGSPTRGPAPFALPKSVRKAVTTAAAKEKHFMSNTNSRAAKLVKADLDDNCKVGKGTRVEQKWAKWQRARFVSAGGKMAYHWLGLLPKLARLNRAPVRFESHLFRIALQYRSGLPCVPAQVRGARCRCKTKEAKTGRRSRMDKYGYHLSSCPWGGWRTSRHDKGNAEVGWGVREAGNNTTWTDATRLMNALPSHRKEKGSRTRRHRIVDVVATDQNGEKSAIDFMVTRVKPRAADALHAAKAGEKMKCHKYDTFLQRCAEENPHDDRLETEVIPVVFETHGAAGPSACRLFAITRHQFGSLVLPCEDKSGEQVFYTAWVHRVSSALQRGTAEMIYNIAEGNRTQSRRAKDVDVEPDEQDPTPPGQLPTESARDSCIDLTEDTATDSESEPERVITLAGASAESGCDDETRDGIPHSHESTTPRRGPLQKPVPSQVIVAAARTRAEKKEKQRAKEAAALSGTTSNNSNSSNHSSSRVSSSNNSAVK